jgi:hypothetical protein
LIEVLRWCVRAFNAPVQGAGEAPRVEGRSRARRKLAQGVMPFSEVDTHPWGRALERGGDTSEGRALEQGGDLPQGRHALERGGGSAAWCLTLEREGGLLEGGWGWWLDRP